MFLSCGTLLDTLNVVVISDVAKSSLKSSLLSNSNLVRCTFSFILYSRTPNFDIRSLLLLSVALSTSEYWLLPSSLIKNQLLSICFVLPLLSLYVILAIDTFSISVPSAGYNVNGFFVVIPFTNTPGFASNIEDSLFLLIVPSPFEERTGSPELAEIITFLLNFF